MTDVPEISREEIALLYPLYLQACRSYRAGDPKLAWLSIDEIAAGQTVVPRERALEYAFGLVAHDRNLAKRSRDGRRFVLTPAGAEAMAAFAEEGRLGADAPPLPVGERKGLRETAAAWAGAVAGILRK